MMMGLLISAYMVSCLRSYSVSHKDKYFANFLQLECMQYSNIEKKYLHVCLLRRN